tara:strand:+ start:15805 stop:16902 length:1098 start_codon:yes stop_codon:yes gene_type:complete
MRQYITNTTLLEQPLMVDSSVYKITDGSNMIIAPRFNFIKAIEDPISSYSWTVSSLDSNYKDFEDGEDSFSTKSVLTGLTEKELLVKISNVSEGEVCFIQISLTITTVGAESYSASSTQTIYKGDPRTVPFFVMYVRNGRLLQSRVYDGQIEQRIFRANQNLGLFNDDEAINNPDKFLTINEHLSSIKNDNIQPSENSATTSFMTHAAQAYPNPSNPGSWRPGRRQGTGPANVEDSELHAAERAITFIIGKKPGYSSIQPKLTNPAYRPVPIKTPGRSTHLVDTSFNAGHPSSPYAMPAGPIAIPYPCGPSIHSIHNFCSVTCSTQTVTETISRQNDVCEDNLDQFRETKEAEVTHTIEKCQRVQ